MINFSDVKNERGQWFYCSDSYVKEIPLSVHKRHEYPSETPYVMFYKKISK